MTLFIVKILNTVYLLLIIVVDNFFPFQMIDFKMFTRLFLRLRLYIESVRLMSPKEKCLYVQGCATVLARLVGCEVTDPNFKPYLLTFCSGILMIDLFGLCIYTITYYANRSDYMKCLEAFCLMGALIPVIFIKKKSYLYLYVNNLQTFKNWWTLVSRKHFPPKSFDIDLQKKTGICAWFLLFGVQWKTICISTPWCFGGQFLLTNASDKPIFLSSWRSDILIADRTIWGILVNFSVDILMFLDYLSLICGTT